MLYPMASKKFRTGPQPGSSVPTRVMTRYPGQKIYHSKALHASNPTVGHSSKSIKYELNYGHLNFHYSSVPLNIIKNFKLKNLFLGVDQKFSSKGVIAEWITSLFESDNVTMNREIESRAGRTFFLRLIIFRITNPLNLKRLQLKILLVLAREPSQYNVF